MALSSGSPAAVLPLADDPRFWLQDLRLGRYAELFRNVEDHAYCAARVRTWFKSRRVLRHVAERLGLPASGTVADLQRRVARAGRGLLPFLAVAAYTARKRPVAVLDVARAVLPPDVLDAARDRRGAYDRLLLLLHLLEHRPEALAHVRGLQAWHKQSGAHLRLEPRPSHRPGIEGFLTRANIEQAMEPVPLPRGVPGVRHEMTIPREGDGVIVVLSRNLRRAHTWTDDGATVQHGHDEELIVLHFTDGGRHVRVSGKTATLPRALAEAIASAWFGWQVTYIDDLSPTEPASLDRLFAALLFGEVQGVRLVEVAVRFSPLVGSPQLVLRTESPDGDISAAVHEFEQKVGPLLDRLEDVLHIKLCFRAETIKIDFRVVEGRPIARFADRGLDRHMARAFRDFLAAEFGLPLHTMEALCA